MAGLKELLLAASVSLSPGISSGHGAPETPDNHEHQQARTTITLPTQPGSADIAKSVIYVPESLRQSYSFLRDTSANSPLHKFAPGTTIFLNPGDAKSNTSAALADVINASLPEGSPYRDLLHRIISSDRNSRGDVTTSLVGSPLAIILPGLKDEHGHQLQIVVMRPLEAYARHSDATHDLFKSFTGVISPKYNPVRSSDNTAFMAAVVLHELGHGKDYTYAIPSVYDRSRIIPPIAAESIADCEANAGAKDPAIGGPLGITAGTMAEYRDGRAISMLLKTYDVHATASQNSNESNCADSFSLATLDKGRDVLDALKETIYKQIGNYYYANVLNAIAKGKESIPADATPDQRKIYEYYAQGHMPPDVRERVLKWHNERDFFLGLTGGQFAGTDQAMVYGVVKRLLTDPQEFGKLPADQRVIAQKFVEAVDRRYPDMATSPAADMMSKVPIFSPQHRVDLLKKHLSELPGATSEPPKAPAMAPA